MTSKFKKIMKALIISFMVIIILMVSVISWYIYKSNPDNYTVEEHINKISKKVEEKFMTDRFDYTEFNVGPLYNENEDVEHYLVEFEPYGYAIIWPKKDFLFGMLYMFKESLTGHDWSPYKVDPKNSQPEPDIDKIWILDENGEKIVYNRSPYKVANLTNERLYLLKGSVPAVKIEGEFKNLVSGDMFVMQNHNFITPQAELMLYVGPPKPQFYL